MAGKKRPKEEILKKQNKRQKITQILKQGFISTLWSTYYTNYFSLSLVGVFVSMCLSLVQFYCPTLERVAQRKENPHKHCVSYLFQTLQIKEKKKLWTWPQKFTPDEYAAKVRMVYNTQLDYQACFQQLPLELMCLDEIGCKSKITM